MLENPTAMKYMTEDSPPLTVAVITIQRIGTIMNNHKKPKILKRMRHRSEPVAPISSSFVILIPLLYTMTSWPPVYG
jgi:hypothetical protein